MKRFIRFSSFLLLSLISLAAIANRVVITGIVSYPNGKTVAQYPVTLHTEAVGCNLTKTVVTNTNGVYEGALECSNPILKVVISYANCEGVIIRVVKEVPTTGKIVYPIVLCEPRCQSKFLFGPIPATPNKLQFNSSVSLPAQNPHDEIISRTWHWGDGTAATTGNVVSPQHQFPGAGSYEVCLVIKTRSGCESKFCQKIVLGEQGCKAMFVFTMAPATNATGFGVQFNSSQSFVGNPASDIVDRQWHFGDGSQLSGNIVSPVHQYREPGNYKVCLRIKTANGCVSEFCKEVIIEKRGCDLILKWELVPWSSTNLTGKPIVHFYNALPDNSPDRIISRKWDFGDGHTLGGNEASPRHPYDKPGKYQVCVYVETEKGCKSHLCKWIEIPERPALTCLPAFEWKLVGLKVEFGSAGSKAMTGDEITSRQWWFGDGASLGGNVIAPTHTYDRPGQYEVCLKIVTKAGCEKRFCKLVMVGEQPNKCLPKFNWDNLGEKKLQFNSNASVSSIANDPIVRRQWWFGDGATLDGNIVSPTHQYRQGGTYSVCLKITTRSGCEARWCNTVKVEGEDRSNELLVKLLTVYPNPVRSPLYVQVWSKSPNEKAELAIFDIYGVKKWSQTVILPQGNSTWQTPTGQLMAGPYVLRLLTKYPPQRLGFYKLQ